MLGRCFVCLCFGCDCLCTDFKWFVCLINFVLYVRFVTYFLWFLYFVSRLLVIVVSGLFRCRLVNVGVVIVGLPVLVMV